MKNIFLAVLGLVLALFLVRAVLSQSQTDRSPLPLPWTTHDVGDVQIPGAASLVDSAFELSGSGGDPFGTSDAFQFTHQTSTGDTVLVARILGFAGTNTGKAGLMFRSSLDPGAVNVLLAMGGSNRITLQRRFQLSDPSEKDTITVFPSPGPQQQIARAGRARIWLELTNSPAAKISTPCWLMLVRRGDDFSAFCSRDGTNWQWLATERIKMPPAAQAGLIVGGYKADALCVARFDQVSLQSPTWTNSIPLIGVGQGLPVTFTPTGTTNSIQRALPTINIDAGRFGPLLAANSFSADWNGFLEPQYTEPYTFQLVHAQCARLWLNGELLLDECQANFIGQSKVTVNLIAGRKYSLRLQCGGQTARDPVKLLWSSPSTPKQIIPQNQLYSPTHPAVITGTNLPPSGIAIDLVKGLEALELTDRLPQLLSPWLARTLGSSTDPAMPTASNTVQPVNGGFVVTTASGGPGRPTDAGFFLYQPWNDDAEFIARINPDSATNKSARAGLMIRADLRADAPVAYLEIDPHNRTRFFFRKRLVSSEFLPPDHRAEPWLKLSRHGDDFAAFSSSDGLQWTWLGSVAVPMPQKVFLGFALGTSDPSQPHHARFDNLRLAVPTPMLPLIGDGDGLSATYYDQTTSNELHRIDSEINFTWGARSSIAPIPGVARTNFSARWEGLLEAQFTEPYRFHVLSEEPVRLWLEGRMIFNGDRPAAALEQRAELQLLAGRRYSIRLEYLHSSGPSGVRLLWSSPGTSKSPIPQSQLYSRDNPAFTAIPDKDHDGMPDDWELAHQLDPLNALDAGLDPDSDGLTNLQEYTAGTDPQNPDSDFDGLPDGWELAHGLNPLDPSDASRDPDRDGLTNLQEFLAGTDPHNPDTDADGLPDGIEANESGTNPLIADTTAIQTILEIPGTNAVAHLGHWAAEASAAYALDGRGWLEYILAAPQDDMYRLEIVGGSHHAYDRDAEFELLVSIDGEYLGRSILAAQNAATGAIQLLTPWLKSGNHRVRVEWDNALWRRSFQLAAVRLQVLQGPDSDNNGIKDWIDNRLRFLCAVEVAPTSSTVSPACIEGRGGYLSMMNIRSAAVPVGPVPPPGIPQHALGNRWFANIPLSSSNSTTIVCSFQNGALRATNQITWRPTNLLQPTGLVVRTGDALLLGAMPPAATNGQMLIAIPGLTNYSSPAGQPVPHRFTDPGSLTLIGTYVSAAGQSISRTSSVTVVPTNLAPGPNPAAWAGKLRPWETSMTAPLTLNPDSHLRLENFDDPATPATEFGLTLDQPDDHYLLARIGTNGAVVTSIPIEGFRLFSGYETAVRRIETYPDGSELVEMGLVLSPLRPNLTIQIDLLVGGVLFDDGTLTRILTSADFNELGQAKVRFLRPPTFKTSVCHITRVYQGATLLGSYP